MKLLLDGVEVHRPGVQETKLFAMTAQVRADWNFNETLAKIE